MPKNRPFNHQKISIIKPMTIVPIITLTVMTGYEGIKQLVKPDINVWESHVVTIIFTTIISMITAYFALRKYQKLYKLLSGVMTVCSKCKKIKDESNHWVQIDDYIHKHSEASFSHGYCPDCYQELKKEIADE
ncbi:MAG TPA: hypothetical protein VF857_08420 [Spirochaetota bacterium]